MPTNLLPREYKNFIFYERLTRFALITGILSAFSLVIGIVLMLPSFFYIYFQGDVITKELEAMRESTKQQEIQALTSEIKKRNELLREFTDFNESEISATSLIVDISGKKIDGIILRSLRYDVAGKAVELSGTHANVDVLEEYISHLESSSFIKEVDSPLRNIYRVGEPFTLKLTLK